jgi:hypothetical protein
MKKAAILFLVFIYAIAIGEWYGFENIMGLFGNKTDAGKFFSNGDGYEDEMSEETKTILDFLNCDFELIPNRKNQKEILDRFSFLAKQGKNDGFYPLIIIPSDVLAEWLEIVSEDDIGMITPEGIAAYRQTLIDAANDIVVEEFFSSRLNELLPYFNVEGFDIVGDFEQASPEKSLYLFMMDYSSCEEIIIAKIPTNNPWELAAWIPMGGFNDCPAPSEQVAVFRYWYEVYGAIPAVVTYDTWQLTLTKPPLTKEHAEELAKEHFAFCIDSVFQGSETIRGLASSLKDSTTWFFWWD